MWRAVIAQSFNDALKDKSDKYYDSKLKDPIDVFNWVFSKNKEFRTVCALADLDHNAVYDRFVQRADRAGKIPDRYKHVLRR